MSDNVQNRFRSVRPPVTIVELLRLCAIERPNRRAYTFLVDGEATEISLTYSQVDRRAQAIGARLQSLAMEETTRALLLYPTGLDFVTSFFGCLYAGITVIPAYPLEALHSDETASMLVKIIKDSAPLVGLTDCASIKLINAMAKKHATLNDVMWITAETIADESAKNWDLPKIGAGTLALLQYTSGSTNVPKGVMVTHENLLWTEAGIREGIAQYSTRLTWRPLSHIAGLKSGIILPLYVGAHSILMSPDAFLQKPVRWLRAISRYNVAASGGPNFAYEECVNRISLAEREDLDLKSWENALIGSEYPNPKILKRFADEFESYGFRRTAFAPNYGLTETVRLVSLTPKLQGLKTLYVDRDALQQNKVVIDPPGATPRRELASSGQPIGQKVVIVDPNSRQKCPDMHVGEIWVDAKYAARGYWNKSRETDYTFNAVLAESDEARFLRTGDLGFLFGNELFVTGRLKDLINIRGRNIYPQDVESTVDDCLVHACPSCAAAFSIDGAISEQIIVIFEMTAPNEVQQDSHDADLMMDRICSTIFEQHNVVPSVLAWVRQGDIRKTPNGKLQRQACRKAYLKGELDILKISNMIEEHCFSGVKKSFVAASTNTEKAVADIWCAVFDRDTIGIDDNFVDLGGHSIMALRFFNRVRERFNIELSAALLFGEKATVRQLANIIESEITRTSSN